MQTLTVADPLADLARLEGVPSAVAAAVAAVDAVLRDRGLRTISGETRAAALATSATASAELTTDPARWLVGSLRLSAELAELAPLIRVAPAQALARAHAVVARGEVADDDLGRVLDRPGVGPRMQGLSALLTTPTLASAAVLGAVVHAELVTVAPFGEANGLVARAAEHLVLDGVRTRPQWRHHDRGRAPGERGGVRAGVARICRGRAWSASRSGCCTGRRRWLEAQNCRRLDREVDLRRERCGRNDLGRDAAPAEAGAVPGPSSLSDHACCSTCWPRETWIATARRGWVIAAWVLECRARICRLVLNDYA